MKTENQHRVLENSIMIVNMLHNYSYFNLTKANICDSTMKNRPLNYVHVTLNVDFYVHEK